MRLLRKTRNNAAQSGLSSAAERRGNVLGVYEAENTDRIRGAKILLIDDILTTGATLGECVRVQGGRRGGCGVRDARPRRDGKGKGRRKARDTGVIWHTPCGT